MKKVLSTVFILALILNVAVSCTPESIERNEQQTDKEEVCPPNDRNCNGIPDNEE